MLVDPLLLSTIDRLLTVQYSQRSIDRRLNSTVNDQSIVDCTVQSTIDAVQVQSIIDCNSFTVNDRLVNDRLTVNVNDQSIVDCTVQWLIVELLDFFCLVVGGRSRDLIRRNAQ